MRVSPTLIFWVVGTLLVISSESESLTPVPILGALDQTFKMSPVQGAWALSATAVAGAATGCVLSRLGDIFGLRRLMLASLLLIAVGNVIDATANGPVMFIAGRAIIGVNASLVFFVVLVRLRSMTNGHVHRGVGLVIAANGAALVLAYLLGGIVLDAGGTARTVMWIMTALSAAILVLGWLFIQDVAVRTRVRIDWIGALLIAASLSSFVIGIGQGDSWGWGSVSVVGLIVAFAVLLFAWGAWELYVPHPLVDLRIVRRREMWPAMMLVGVYPGLGIASTLAVSYYVQTPKFLGYGFGGTALTAGLYLLPLGVMVTVGGTVMEPILGKLGERVTAAIGSLLAAASFLWLAYNHNQPWEYIVMFLVFGVGFTLTNTAAYAFIKAARPGEGGMLMAGTRMTSMAFTSLAPAVVIAVLTASVIPHMGMPQAGNYTHVWILLGVCSLVVFGISLFVRNSTINHALADHAEVIGPWGEGTQGQPGPVAGEPGAAL
jgi:predicted MFS family arabinose efflux permease